MARDRYYTPLQSIPGIAAMPIALTIMATAAFGPRTVLEHFQQSAGTLMDIVQRSPEIINNFIQLVR